MSVILSRFQCVNEQDKSHNEAVRFIFCNQIWIRRDIDWNIHSIKNMYFAEIDPDRESNSVLIARSSLPIEFRVRLASIIIKIILIKHNL